MTSNILLLDYFKTSYTLHCPQLSYRNTNAFFTQVVLILSPFSIILGSYGMLVILFATPKHMEGVKWFLFHYHFVTFFIEILLNNLIAPLFFLPSTAVYCNGFLADIGIPFKVLMYIVDVSFIANSLSMLMIFENRHSQILTIPYRITRRTTKVVFYVLHYIIFPCLPLSYYLKNIDRDSAKIEILSSIPCPEPHFFSDKTRVITMEMELFASISGSIVVYFTLLVNFFALQSGYYLLRRPSLDVSAAMRNMQRRFFLILSIQIAVPVVFMLIPNIIYYSASEIDQFISTMTVVFVSLHGLVSSIMLIVLHTPYREFTWDNSLGRCFGSSRAKLSGQSVRPNTLTHGCNWASTRVGDEWRVRKLIGKERRDKIKNEYEECVDEGESISLEEDLGLQSRSIKTALTLVAAEEFCNLFENIINFTHKIIVKNMIIGKITDL